MRISGEIRGNNPGALPGAQMRGTWGTRFSGCDAFFPAPGPPAIPKRLVALLCANSYSAPPRPDAAVSTSNAALPHSNHGDQ